MKIFFRYLLMRLFQVFAICLASFTLVWIMVDLYGNIDDFLEHKANVFLVLQFYVWNIPKMLVTVLPTTLLVSTLFTLLSLNRRCELVAFQSGGMAPLLLFSPFILFAVIWVVVLAYDMSGPSATAEVTRERLLKQVKGDPSGRGGFSTLPYVDNIGHRVWFFQSLDTTKGKAWGVEILQRDEQGRDLAKYAANEAEWNGEFWRLSGGVLKSVAGDNGILQEPKKFQELDLPEIATPPKQLSLSVSLPNQLTLSQLSQYITTSTTTPEHMADYRTEWWYRVLYPFSLLVLMLYALLHGMPSARRTAVVGMAWAIGVLGGFTLVMFLFMVAGRHNRLPPFLAVIAAQVIFGAIGLHLLAVSNGWWWQLRQWWKQWQAARAVQDKGELAE